MQNQNSLGMLCPFPSFLPIASTFYFGPFMSQFSQGCLSSCISNVPMYGLSFTQLKV